MGVGLPQGTGGEVSFEAHEYGTTVETIEAWALDRNIACIKMKMFDSENEPFTIGKQPDGNPTSTFTFVRGDTLTGDIVLSTNSDRGAPARIGYIQFKTKGGKEFSVGDSGGPDYRFPSGESYLTGFHGLNDGLVHALGLYMMKPYPESKLVVDRYFTESLEKIPVKLEGGSFTNPSLEPITQTFTVTKRTSTTNEWSVENSFGFTFGTSIEASIPEVGGITTSYEINFSTSSTQTNTKYVEEEVSQTIQFIGAPCTNTTYQSEWYESNQPVEFNGTIQYSFKDGSTWSFPAEGIWKGVISSEVFTRATLVTPIVSGVCSSTPTLPSSAPTTIPLFTSMPSSAPTTLMPTGAPALPSSAPTIPLFTSMPSSAPTTLMPTGAPTNGPISQIPLPEGVYITNARDVYITLCSANHQSSGGDGPTPPTLEPSVQHTPMPEPTDKPTLEPMPVSSGEKSPVEAHQKSGKKSGKKTGKKTRLRG